MKAGATMMLTDIDGELYLDLTQANDLLLQASTAKYLLEKGRKYMSHDQKCQFKFKQGCTCGYTSYLEELTL